MTERIPTYEEFWPYYLREHAKPVTRTLHFVGTGLGILLFVVAVALMEPWLLLAALVSGYAFAWIGHAFVEHNRPATFIHPWWSLVSDFRMFGLWASGRLGPELEKAGVRP